MTSPRAATRYAVLAAVILAGFALVKERHEGLGFALFCAACALVGWSVALVMAAKAKRNAL